MSTQPTEATATAPQQETEQPIEQPKPTETVEFWREKAREQEKRAKSNAEAAKRLAEIEDAQKSEAQKAAEAVAKAEQRAAEAESRANSLQIATEFKLGAEDAALLAALPDEESRRALAVRLAGQVEEQKKNGNRVPKEGTSTTSSPTGDDEMREFARGLFKRAAVD